MATCDDNNLTEQKELQETSTQHTPSAENIIQQPGDEKIQEDLKTLKAIISNQDLPTAVRALKDFLEKQEQVELNIAVTGESGSGKSKFVNAFRGLGDEEMDSAKTGVVQTTKEPQCYLHPKYKNVKMWDLPGIGTEDFKAEEYHQKVPLNHYDFFIIVGSERFRESHIQLAKEIRKIKKKFYFVRTKIDNDMNGERHKKTFDEEDIQNRIRNNCKDGLKNIGIGASDVFLISSLQLGKYDFNLLQERLEKDLPKHKRHVLKLAAPNITEEIIERKKKALGENIPMVAFLSASVAAIPFPGLSFSVDLFIIKSEIEKYYTAFDLGDPSMQKFLPNYGKKSWHDWLNSTTLLSLVSAVSVLASESTAEYYCSLIPVLGTLVAGGMSYFTVSRILQKALNELAENAKKVLNAELHSN
ncbi:interferon-inducible GTPase 5-like [Triplophysa rosa]|uniref:Interferon-inducible GTPase 5-like n=1 Tax=Triplophysa rosa TaxID=992332 RepID=A0A9W7TTT4_TRIRA|nr:interferon-inducible GTPase 5-like [Triplophysa rosa]KAI7803225.1 putative interferon-inducible GTPase 5-like [Triplophysa rosa]